MNGEKPAQNAAARPPAPAARDNAAEVREPGRLLAYPTILLGDLLTEAFADAAYLQELRTTFQRDGYVRLPQLISAEVLAAMRSEMQALQANASQQQFVMQEYQTPRRLSVVGGSRIVALSPALASLYSHHDIRMIIGTLAGRTIFPCRHPEEFMVANFLVNGGDTHGWHLDDPSYALVILLDAPDEPDGGLLEYIADWRGFQARQPDTAAVAELVRRARAEGLVRRLHHAAGEAYLLKADDCLHRVTELTSPAAYRSALNLAFQSERSIAYGETASRLYGPARPEDHAMGPARASYGPGRQ